MPSFSYPNTFFSRSRCPDQSVNEAQNSPRSARSASVLFPYHIHPSDNLSSLSASQIRIIHHPQTRSIWTIRSQIRMGLLCGSFPVPRNWRSCSHFEPLSMVTKLERRTLGSRCAFPFLLFLFQISAALRPAPPIGCRFDELTPTHLGHVLGFWTKQEGISQGNGSLLPLSTSSCLVLLPVVEFDLPSESFSRFQNSKVMHRPLTSAWGPMHKL